MNANQNSFHFSWYPSGFRETQNSSMSVYSQLGIQSNTPPGSLLLWVGDLGKEEVLVVRFPLIALAHFLWISVAAVLVGTWCPQWALHRDPGNRLRAEPRLHRAAVTCRVTSLQSSLAFPGFQWIAHSSKNNPSQDSKVGECHRVGIISDPTGGRKEGGVGICPLIAPRLSSAL